MANNANPTELWGQIEEIEACTRNLAKLPTETALRVMRVRESLKRNNKPSHEDANFIGKLWAQHVSGGF
jgi:hypothetical protein